jgi:hypothetical protein
LVSTSQAGQVVAVGAADGEVVFSFRLFDQAMGVDVARDRVGRRRPGADLDAG